jgi:hypothetical protein
LDEIISDHDTIFFTVKTNIQKKDRPKQAITKEVKLYKKINLPTLNNLIEKKLQDHQTQNFNDLNTQPDDLINTVHSAITEIVPTKLLSPKTNYREKPWLHNEEVRRTKNRVNYLWKKCRYNTNPQLTDQLWSEYKIVRNQYTRLLRRCKILYFEEKINFCKDDSKLMWQTLKKLICSSSSTDSDKFESIKFSVTYNNLALVNKFNKIFIESVEEIAQSITEEDTYNAFSELKKLNITSKLCDFVKLNINDLRKIISGMKNVSSCDPVNIHMLNRYFQQLAQSY